MLSRVTRGQSVIGGAGGRSGVQGTCEVRGLNHDAGLHVQLQLHLDLDFVAGRNSSSLPVGFAEAEQVSAPHDGNPALPGMPVDRDGHRRPLAPTECLYNFLGNLQSPHGFRRFDVGSKLHDRLQPSRVRWQWVRCAPGAARSRYPSLLTTRLVWTSADRTHRRSGSGSRGEGSFGRRHPWLRRTGHRHLSHGVSPVPTPTRCERATGLGVPSACRSGLACRPVGGPPAAEAARLPSSGLTLRAGQGAIRAVPHLPPDLRPADTTHDPLTPGSPGRRIRQLPKAGCRHRCRTHARR